LNEGGKGVVRSDKTAQVVEDIASEIATITDMKALIVSSGASVR